jgi:hypothetical protein
VDICSGGPLNSTPLQQVGAERAASGIGTVTSPSVPGRNQGGFQKLSLGTVELRVMSFQFDQRVRAGSYFPAERPAYQVDYLVAVVWALAVIGPWLLLLLWWLG